MILQRETEKISFQVSHRSLPVGACKITLGFGSTSSHDLVGTTTALTYPRLIYLYISMMIGGSSRAASPLFPSGVGQSLTQLLRSQHGLLIVVKVKT